MIQTLKNIEKELIANYQSPSLPTAVDLNENIIKKAVLESNFEDVQEYSADFFTLYNLAVEFEQVKRKKMLTAILEDSFWSNFEKALISGYINVAKIYDKYYVAWLKEVRLSQSALHIQEMLKNNPDEISKIISEQKLDNHYTIIVYENNRFSQVPYAVFFKNIYQELERAFDNWLAELDKNITNKEDKECKNMIAFLAQYKECLMETDIAKLESQWHKLDELWMLTHGRIQIVHDMEYGYGDPLRTKVIPEFSLRILDSQYEKENNDIEKVKQVMINYFKQRETPLSQAGLSGLANCHAGIYYVPFKTGMTYHFRFSGQSIPNRADVREKYGVKIYFDPISTGIRQEEIKKLANKVFADKSLPELLDVNHTIIYHVSSHEFGHAIYGLSALEGEITNYTKSMLEESRAELTTLTTLLLLHEEGILDQNDLEKAFINFVLSDLRRFANFKSEPLRPYTISAVNCYNSYEKTGFLKLEDEKIVIDRNKIKGLLENFRKQFKQILVMEDNRDAKGLDKLLRDMQKEGALVRFLKEKLGE